MIRTKRISEETFQGTVKWFSYEKGFGFITPNKTLKINDGKKNDLFVHISTLMKHNISQLNENDKVLFNIEESTHGKMSAINIKVVEDF
ncbi:cold shock family protein [Cunninghamella echinulata]|nr:cold shock family protein [Cunninghamella echinulata]